MSLIEHIENVLGRIEEGWGLTDSPSGIRVVAVRHQPIHGAVTYLTIGLSDHVLPMNPTRDVRQELVFSAHESFPRGPISSFLLTFSEFVASKHRALLRGDVVGPADSIIPGVRLNSVYSAIPMTFPERLATFDGTIPPTVLVWLIPLHEKEAEFAKSQGWNRFEDLLEEKDPDLLDLNRPTFL
jgi:hypothetical protein